MRADDKFMQLGDREPVLVDMGALATAESSNRGEESNRGVEVLEHSRW